jgi:hypothetical protein
MAKNIFLSGVNLDYFLLIWKSEILISNWSNARKLNSCNKFGRGDYPFQNLVKSFLEFSAVLSFLEFGTIMLEYGIIHLEIRIILFKIQDYLFYNPELSFSKYFLLRLHIHYKLKFVKRPFREPVYFCLIFAKMQILIFVNNMITHSDLKNSALNCSCFTASGSQQNKQLFCFNPCNIVLFSQHPAGIPHTGPLPQLHRQSLGIYSVCSGERSL